jgi:LPXTG-motif cell wall-anchored protein
MNAAAGRTLMSRRHRRSLLAIATLAVALSGTLFMAGCGGNRANDGTTPPSAADAIERTALKGPAKLLVRVWPRQPRLSDLVSMDVLIEAQPGVEIKPPAFGQAVGDFLIRDYSEPPPETGAKNLRRFHYQLEPTHAGKHLIRSVSLQFVDNRPQSERRGETTLIETDPLEVDVTSELGENAPNLADLEPMVPPRSVPRGFATGWLIAAGVAALLAVLAIVLWRRRKRRPIEPKRLTALEIAHAALARLLAEDLPARGLFKEFYLRLTGIVRQYVEDTTGIRAPEQTTEEFLRDMRSRAVFPHERSNRLAEFLEAADLVKYAGQEPQQQEIDQSIARAQEFVNAKASPSAAVSAVGAAS